MPAARAGLFNIPTARAGLTMCLQQGQGFQCAYSEGRTYNVPVTRVGLLTIQ